MQGHEPKGRRMQRCEGGSAGGPRAGGHQSVRGVRAQGCEG